MRLLRLKYCSKCNIVHFFNYLMVSVLTYLSEIYLNIHILLEIIKISELHGWIQHYYKYIMILLFTKFQNSSCNKICQISNRDNHYIKTWIVQLRAPNFPNALGNINGKFQQAKCNRNNNSNNHRSGYWLFFYMSK